MEKEKYLFLCYAVFLCVIGMFASDMYLPTLNQIRSDFHTTEALVGLSVSVYMGGFAFAQLVYGPLSDQLGRKLPLILGLIVFIAGTFGCVYSPNVYVFLGSRLLQAAGVSAAYVLWQPMVIDSFKGSEAQRLFSFLIALNALSPAVAPLVGGYVGEVLGWRAVFWLLQGFTLVILFWTIFIYKEPSNIGMRAKKFSPIDVFRGYRELFRSYIFIFFSLIVALSAALYFVYLTVIPFVLHNLGYSPREIGVACVPFALAFMSGTHVATRLHPRLGDLRLIKRGVAGAVIGTAGLLLVSILAPCNGWPLIVLFCVITFANGFVIPIGMGFLIQRNSNMAGSCASAIGFVVSFVAFVSTAVASFLVKPMGVGSISVVMGGLSVLMVYMFAVGAKGCERIQGEAAH